VADQGSPRCRLRQPRVKLQVKTLQDHSFASRKPDFRRNPLLLFFDGEREKKNREKKICGRKAETEKESHGKKKERIAWGFGFFLKGVG